MKTTTKTVAPFEVKEIDEGARTFSGLASTWDEDLGGDVIHKGAFKKSIGEWLSRKNGKRLPLIDQHNYDSIQRIVGGMTDAEETDAGLDADFSVRSGAVGDDALGLLKERYIDGLSIGYEAVKWETEEKPESRYGRIRHIKEVKLFEISLVIWPMNEGARVDPSSVKSVKDAIASFEGRSLNAEEKADLQTLYAKLGALLTPEPEPAKEAAPELINAIQSRILKLKLHRAVTGIRQPTLGERS